MNPWECYGDHKAREDELFLSLHKNVLPLTHENHLKEGRFPVDSAINRIIKCREACK